MINWERTLSKVYMKSEGDGGCDGRIYEKCELNFSKIEGEIVSNKDGKKITFGEYINGWKFSNPPKTHEKMNKFLKRQVESDEAFLQRRDFFTSLKGNKDFLRNYGMKRSALVIHQRNYL